MKRFAFALLAACLFLSDAVGQQSYPMLMSIEPVSAQIGQTSEHVVKSRYTMEGAYEILISGEGVHGEAVLPDVKEGEKKPAALQALTIRLTVDPDATPGVRDFRVATPTGISTTGQVVIVQDPVVVEAGENNTIAAANEVKLPATICGRIEKAEDVDFFKFHADAGDSFCFHVRCMRLQDLIHDLQQHADPILAIRNASGSTVASTDNVFAADPFLSHTFDESGDYFLEIRDVRYQGNQYWCYSIEANSRPFVRTIFPLAVSSQGDREFELIGQALGEKMRGTLLSEQASPGIRQALVSIDQQNSQPVEVVFTDQPTVEEDAADNNTVKSAESITAPSAVNGKIEADGDIDCFALEAKKGERYTMEVTARRVGSKLDPHLRILNEQGSQQQLNDDMRVGKRTFADSRIENWVVPADGKYVIEVRDVHLRGGQSFVYVLSIARSEPHFTLFADTDKTPLTPGTSGVVFVRAEKKNGFDEEIQLQVDGLPAGVKAACGKILPGKQQDGCIVFTADPDTKPSVSEIRISGVATVTNEQAQSREITADATVYQEIYQPGGGRGHWPVGGHVISVGKPGDVRAVSLSTHELTLKPGESASIDVEIERAEGFDKNVTLELVYKHLNTVFGDPLPEGVSIDKSASKVLLTGGATQGKITLKASPDAQLAERQLFTVMANVSINFVMKATYASEPVFVTVNK